MARPRKQPVQRKSTHQRTRRATPNAWRKAFLASLSKNGNVTDACEVARIDRSTAYKSRANDEKFAALWDETVEVAVDRLESEAWRRATYGTNKPVWYKGQLVGTELEYSDSLMQTLLKAHRPNKYKDRVEVEYAMPPQLIKLLKERDMKASDIWEAMLQELTHENTPTNQEDNPK